jgi:hypothetical protein
MSSFSLGQSRLFLIIAERNCPAYLPFLGFVLPPLFLPPAASTFSDRPTFFQPGGVGAKRKQKASAAFPKAVAGGDAAVSFKYNRLKRSAAI